MSTTYTHSNKNKQNTILSSSNSCEQVLFSNQVQHCELLTICSKACTQERICDGSVEEQKSFVTLNKSLTPIQAKIGKKKVKKLLKDKMISERIPDSYIIPSKLPHSSFENGITALTMNQNETQQTKPPPTEESSIVSSTNSLSNFASTITPTVSQDGKDESKIAQQVSAEHISQDRIPFLYPNQCHGQSSITESLSCNIINPQLRLEEQQESINSDLSVIEETTGRNLKNSMQASITSTEVSTVSSAVKEHESEQPQNSDYLHHQNGCLTISGQKKISAFTPKNRKRSTPFTPAKKEQPISLSGVSQQRDCNQTSIGISGTIQSAFQNSFTPHHCNKIENNFSYDFSPSIHQIGKPPSTLFTSGGDIKSKSSKSRSEKGVACIDNDDDVSSAGTTPVTPFRFSSFPASLPRIRPWPSQKSNHIGSATDQNESIEQFCRRQNSDIFNGTTIKGRTLFSSSSIIDRSACLQNDNGATSSILTKTFPAAEQSNSKNNNIFQVRSPNPLSGRYRSLDTSYDTSISSISVGSPISPRAEGRMQHRIMSPLLSRGSEDGLSLSESMELENEEWSARKEMENRALTVKEKVEFISPGGSIHGHRKVSGTKLNFNALSPDTEINLQNQTAEATSMRANDFMTEENDSNHLTETFGRECRKNFSSTNSGNLPEIMDRNILEQTNEMRTPFRISSRRRASSFLTSNADFKYHFESTQCSPIHCNEDSCSSASPTDLIIDNGPPIESQDCSTSEFSISSSSSKARKLRPMPDISAFEVGRSGERRSSGNSKSNLSGSAASPLHLLCPPTPVRTPAWAHNESLTPSFTGQDSLISSKVLAACPRELLDGFSSFENSLGDENTNTLSMDQTPTRNGNKKFFLANSSQPEAFILPSVHEDSNKFAKGRCGRFSTGSTYSMNGSNYPPATLKKTHPQPMYRKDPIPTRTVGEVGSSISFETDFENLGQIGSGNFARVYKARSKADNCLYAIKKNRRQFRGKRDRENALAEVRTMQRLQASGKRSSDEKSKGFCPYLLLFVRAWQEDGYFFCQTEICSRENCRNLMLSLSTDWNIAKKRYPSLLRNLSNGAQDDVDIINRLLPEKSVWKICHDVIAGLSHIHSHDIVHNDIKPSNIFFASHCRLGCICKIGDFGLAVDFDSVEDGYEGDTKYMPQELLSSSKKHPSADIFSFGLTLYELAASCLFVLPSEGPRWHSIRKGAQSLDIPDTRSNSLVSTIKSMINPDPSKRPKALDILYGVPNVKESGILNDKFLSDYVKNVHDYDLTRERELAALQKEASMSRSTPTTGSFSRHEFQGLDRSWNTSTPTGDCSTSTFCRGNR